MNHALMEMARSTPNTECVEKSFWGDAVVIATYYQNRATMSHLKTGFTIFQLCTGRKPEVNHIRIFGSQFFYKIPARKLQKLDNSGRFATFVGYLRS